MAYNEDLARRVRGVLARTQGITEKKMFGGLAFMRHGHMMCGIIQDDFMARVGPDAYETALNEPGARKMDFNGRPMKGYVYVDQEHWLRDSELRSWIRRCLTFTQSLPAK